MISFALRGLPEFCARFPTVETVGYFRTSLWDWTGERRLFVSST